MERLVKADVRYRFVIDIGNTLKSSSCLLVTSEFKVCFIAFLQSQCYVILLGIGFEASGPHLNFKLLGMGVAEYT
uniref:Uncharacterized protein n=1 Tax=Quercus lobata TaxID=97700 RepID=A0A7N2LZD0_QUELO